MIEKLYTLHVNQWPAAVTVTVRVIESEEIGALVEAVDGFPFFSGIGQPVLSQDCWWYNRQRVLWVRLVEITSVPQ